jgi:hypothetical protein
MAVTTKYNHTLWQKITLPFLWVYWKLSVSDSKKTWHLVKKGIEHHRCNFTVSYKYGGETFMMCEHEGCQNCETID